MTKKATYSALRKELDDIMARLQDTSMDIDEATKLHERANEIIDQLETYLEKAEHDIKKLEKKKTGETKSK